MLHSTKWRLLKQEHPCLLQQNLYWSNELWPFPHSSLDKYDFMQLFKASGMIHFISDNTWGLKDKWFSKYKTRGESNFWIKPDVVPKVTLWAGIVELGESFPILSCNLWRDKTLQIYYFWSVVYRAGQGKAWFIGLLESRVSLVSLLKQECSTETKQYPECTLLFSI